MKFFCFHLMPYAALDPDYDKKYSSAWVTLPNSYYDPKIGHQLYNRYLDELEFADAMGFDGLCVNEHHQNAYGLMPVPGRDGGGAGAPHQDGKDRHARPRAAACSTIRSRWRKNSPCSTASPADGWSPASCAASAPNIIPSASTRPSRTTASTRRMT